MSFSWKEIIKCLKTEKGSDSMRQSFSTNVRQNLLNAAIFSPMRQYILWAANCRSSKEPRSNKVTGEILC